MAYSTQPLHSYLQSFLADPSPPSSEGSSASNTSSAKSNDLSSSSSLSSANVSPDSLLYPYYSGHTPYFNGASGQPFQSTFFKKPPPPPIPLHAPVVWVHTHAMELGLVDDQLDNICLLQRRMQKKKPQALDIVTGSKRRHTNADEWDLVYEQWEFIRLWRSEMDRGY